MSLWRAANWSIVIAALLLIPYDALRVYWFLYGAPAQGVIVAVEGSLETADQRLEVALKVAMAMPFVLAVYALALFVVLAPIFLLGRIVQRRLLLPLTSRE